MFIVKPGPELRQLVISVIVNFTYLHIGMGAAILSPTLAKLRDVNQTTLNEPLSDSDSSWITSVSFLSGGIAIWFSSYLSRFLGRKTCILLLCVPRLAMCYLYLFATRAWMLVLARTLNGITDTILPHTTSYASEIASTKVRGAICVISQITAGLGVMLMLSVGPYTSFLTLHIINTCIVTLTCLPLIFIPESPYYLYSKGKKEDCIKILAYLRGSNILAQEVYQEYLLIKEVKANVTDILKDKIALKAIGIVIILAICAVAVGYNIIMPNLQGIFETSQTNISPELSSLISGCIQLVGAFCAVLLTDRLGRKPLLTTSLLGLAVGMFGLGIYFKLMENKVNITGALNYLPLVSIMFVMLCNTVGIGGLAFPVMAELFEGPLRNLGISVGQFTILVVLFLGTKYYYSILAALEASATYWMFAGFSIFACVFIAFFVPETKGKPFSQIQEELGRKEMVLG